MNFIGVMPGPNHFRNYMFFYNFKPNGQEYIIKNMLINNTGPKDDERWDYKANLIFNIP